MEENYKHLYESLLQSEDLFEMFSSMTGVWEKDKKKFTKLQKEMEDLAKDLTIEIDEEDFEDYE